MDPQALTSLYNARNYLSISLKSLKPRISRISSMKNQKAAFQHHVSTTENVAIYLWEKLRVQMKKPKLLYKVTVEETPKNIFTYKGEI